MNTFLLLQTPFHHDVALIGGLVFAAGVFAFWLGMWIHCLRSNRTNEEKMLWVVVMGVLHVIGAFLYLFLARQRELVTERESAGVGR